MVWQQSGRPQLREVKTTIGQRVAGVSEDWDASTVTEQAPRGIPGS